MANKKPQKPAPKTVTKTQQVVSQAPPRPVIKETFLSKWFPYITIALFALLLYCNTLQNQYAIDDTIVLTDNKFTKKGAAGIKDLITHDMFVGFFGQRGDSLVSGGRYRPLSMASFAVEYEIMRKVRGDKRDVIDEKNIIMTDADPYLNPFLSHLINILLFAVTCALLYYLLKLILPYKYSIYTSLGDVGLPFIATLLYAAHPIHTEAVANIKGRDEVMCMMFSLAALIYAVQYVKTNKVSQLIIGTVIFFLALFSKENAITFLAVVPLTLFFFTKAKPRQYIITGAAYLVPIIIFMIMRSSFTNSDLTHDSPEILNNPFVNNDNLGNFNEFGIRYGTTVFTFLKYYILMIFPYWLTHDYYFKQVPYVGLGSPLFLISALITIGLVGYALFTLRKKSIISYGILYFFITFSVASNIFFTVGVLMNERFIYMSSLGFCIILAYLIVMLLKKPRYIGIAAFVILGLYSVKTFSRNFDWYDSFTLFRRDVNRSPNSAKIQTSLGGDLLKTSDHVDTIRKNNRLRDILIDLNVDRAKADEIVKMPNDQVKRILIDSAISHLNKAIEIYPIHSQAYLLLGNAYWTRNANPDEAIPIYEKAAAYRQGGYYDANFNLGVIFNSEKVNKPDSAVVNLLRANKDKPDHIECYFLLAQSYAKINKPAEVAKWLKSGDSLRATVGKGPSAADYYEVGQGFGKSARNFPAAVASIRKGATYDNPKDVAYNVGTRYLNIDLADSAVVNLSTAFNTTHKDADCAYLLSIAYAKGNSPEGVEMWLSKANALRPATAVDYYTIGTGFGKVANNLPMAIKYLEKAIEMDPKAPQFYEDLGVAYGLNKQYDQAIAASEKLLTIDPNYAAAYTTMGISYMNKGNMAKAKECFEKAHALNPKLAQPPMGQAPAANNPATAQQPKTGK